MGNNRFEIVEKESRTVGYLRSIYEAEHIPPDAADSDVFVRVIGLCIEGPDKGKKAGSFHLLSPELAAIPGVLEREALATFEHLAPYLEQKWVLE